MKFLKDVKSIKARIFLNQDIDDNEIFSIAINAKNRSEQRSFDEAMKLLSKPLSKQSNILLLELFRISINKNDSKLALRLANILVRKTNQSFVIRTVLDSQNYTLRRKLIESIEQNKKLKASNKIYLFSMLWQMKKIPKKLLLEKVKLYLDKLLFEYQFDIGKEAEPDNWYLSHQNELANKRFLLNLMNLTIFLAKIGYAKKAISYFKRGFGLLKTSEPTRYQYLFKCTLQGWGFFNKERRFTDGICDFDGITQYLDTDFKTFFNTPFNQSELEISRLKTTNALIFANEFAKFSNDTNILEIIFPIHVSNGFFHGDTFGYISLIERVNKNDFDKNWADKINKYFFDKQHYSSKIAFLGLSEEIRQKNNIDDNKIKDLFTNKVFAGRLDGLFYYCRYSKKVIYCGGCKNTIAFKFVYEKADKNIKDWLEDLFVAKKLTFNGKFSASNLNRTKIEDFKKMFDEETARNFEKHIQMKLSKLSQKGIIRRFSASDISENLACHLMKESRDSENYKKGIDFLRKIYLYPSFKFANPRELRADLVKEKRGIDYMRSKAFRKELNKFIQAFLELKQEQQKHLWPDNYGRNLSSIVYPYCSKATCRKYSKQNPYSVFRSFKPQSVSEIVRIKKEKARMSQLSDEAFLKDYTDYVSVKLKECPHSADTTVRTLNFLEEAEQRFSLSEVRNLLRKDLNQLPCPDTQWNSLASLDRGGQWWHSYSTTVTVSDLLLNEIMNIIKKIKEMSKSEIKKHFSNRKIMELAHKDFLAVAFFNKFPSMVIYDLTEGGIFKKHSYQKKCYFDMSELDMSELKKALQNICDDLESTNDFHSKKTEFASNIFEYFFNEDPWSNLKDWSRAYSKIVSSSFLPIYENMASYLIEMLKEISLKDDNQAESFINCFKAIFSIKSQRKGIKDSKNNLNKIYSQLEETARKILKKDKIDGVTGTAFIKIIDLFLGYDGPRVKRFMKQKQYQKLKLLLRKCAIHLIQITKITFKEISLNDNKLYEEAAKNYLRSIKEFDTKYLGSLNRVVPSKDFLEYTRKYKVPYWANSLNIYCKA